MERQGESDTPRGDQTPSTPQAYGPAHSSTMMSATPPRGAHHMASGSLSTIGSSRSHREYMDSLVVPSSEEISHIAEVQGDRETERKRRSRELHAQHHSTEMQASSPRAGHKPRPSLTERLQSGESVNEILRSRAATVIQRHYRGYRVRRQMKGLNIDANTRWVHAIREAQYRELTRPRPRSELEGDVDQGAAEHAPDGRPSTAARRNWKKAAFIAKRAGLDQDSDGSDSDSGSSSSSNKSHTSEQKREAKRLRGEAKKQRRKEAKMMGMQYFLEMVDLKHRYGSNLRTYHEVWKKSDTHENFFYWLDYGEGRNVSVDGCPRERLDREQVRYLSREERQHYLVKVDGEGHLCWAKNGVRIDTTEQWKDSIHGIVPADDATPAFQGVSANDTPLLGDSRAAESDSEQEASESELEAARAAKYASPGLDEAKGVKKVTHISASTIFNRLLRKSVKKNTWIFVADTSFRLYVGIKNSGAFQHSSFLQGSRISAAGLIKIKNGRLSSLSPLSGHYRPPAANFRAFVKSLREEGVDMGHVSISKSYAVLVGLEAYMKTRQKGKDVMKKMSLRKEKIMAPDEARRREEAERDKSKSAEKERNFLEGQERRRDENSAVAHLVQKLRITPREPAVQKSEGGGEAHGDGEVPHRDREVG